MSQKVTILKFSIDKAIQRHYNYIVTNRDTILGKEIFIVDKMQIAKRLKELRGQKSIRVVAEECGISHSALAMYETGQRIPKDNIKLRLAQYYGTSVEVLFFAQECHNS